MNSDALCKCVQQAQSYISIKQGKRSIIAVIPPPDSPPCVPFRFFFPPAHPKHSPLRSTERLITERTSKPTFVSVQKKKKKKVSLFQQRVDVNPPPSSFPSLSHTFWSVLKLFFFSFSEIFPDMQALKRFPPRAGAGGRCDAWYPCQCFWCTPRKQPALRLPLPPSASWGENIFTAPRIRTWYAAVFTPQRPTGSARLSSAWNWMKGQHAHRHDWEVAGGHFCLASN